MKANYFFYSILLFQFCSCNNQEPVFELLQATKTNIHFSNTIQSNDSINALVYEYIYNGGGVAAGDLDGDGQTDLVFTGNQVTSQIYLNKGGFQFENITKEAGLTTDRWCTGVALVDINEDNLLDIYISVAGYNIPKEKMANLLFINQGVNEKGVPVFEEKAVDFGIDDTGYSTQAAFLDYDLDGDLDMYLLTNALEKFHRNSIRPKRIKGEAESTDRLYRNNGDNTFTNVSQQAGITIEGYGLGVAISDLNLDGYPDIYTANDFLSNDLVWINNGDGTFKNQAGTYLKHQTHNGMGVDIADFNNDGLPDIAVLDMLPEGNQRQKMMMPYINGDKFKMKQDLGYQDQYMRNTLQLHRGFHPDGTPRFSEIANLSGMASTDWSWSILFADFDNDGWKDAYVTNGYRKDVTNLDYINYSSSHQMFGNTEAKLQKAIDDLVNAPDVLIQNYLFKNKGSLQFEDVTKDWGLGKPSFSNGAVYADLDNDGDLDLVVNNIDSKAFIFKNNTIGKQGNIPIDKNYLQIKLEAGASKNNKKYNAKILLYANNQVQYQEYAPYRGYKSTMGDQLHFGLGSAKTIDSLFVYWLDGSVNYYTEVAANQQLIVKHEKASIYSPTFSSRNMSNPILQATNGRLNIDFQHKSNNISDLGKTRTLPHHHSKSGPSMTKGDINGDGLEDFFVGGNINQHGVFFIQQADGTFTKEKLSFDSAFQDVACLLFDADNDNDLDLYVVSGGTHQPVGDPVFQDRLYLNRGNGQFEKSKNILPKINASGGCVKAADYDKDGDLDLFIGGRILPDKYPFPAESYLLEYENGKYINRTPPELQSIGLVTDATWTDFNQDGAVDLIVVGEWMPITFFENKNGELKIVNPIITTENQQNISKTNGWWFHLNAADMDNDGDMDYLVGNLGLNSKLTASATEPTRIYAKDFDNNGAIDPLISCYTNGESYLLHERDLLIAQIPAMKRRFPNYSKYASTKLENVLTKKDLEGAYIAESNLFESVILENQGNNQFILHFLPEDCQFSPIFSSQFMDLNGDGHKDILTVGNFQATETTQIGWYDAAYGNVLMNKTNMDFESINPLQAGFSAEGDVRSMIQLKWKGNGNLIITGSFGAELSAWASK